MTPEQVEQLLQDFRELPEDWDSYGASPITIEAICQARATIALATDLPCHIAPTPDGGVLVEYRWLTQRRELEVHIGPDGSLGYLATTHACAEADNVSTDIITSLLRGTWWPS